MVSYQCYGSQIDKTAGWIFADQGIERLKPDLIIVYNPDIKTAISRARKVSGKEDYFENKPLDYFKRVQEGFDEGVRRYNTQVIDATQSIEDIHKETIALVGEALKARSKSF